METVVKQIVPVNFLVSDKKVDWRFETSDSLSNKGIRKPKTVYWIGILDRKSLHKDQTEYPLYFINHHGDLKEDCEWKREPDGDRGNGLVTIMYDFSKILSQLIPEEKGVDKYLSFLISEEVHENGQLSVSILINKEKSGLDMFLTSFLRSNEPWTELPTFKTAYLSSIDVSTLSQIPIRYARAYKWQK